jgi:hypothetical protein
VVGIWGGSARVWGVSGIAPHESDPGGDFPNFFS